MQIFKLFFKNKKGEKVEYDIGADAINIQENSTHRFITDVERQQWNAKLEEKDLGAAAKYAVANNDTTTAPGFLADARVVKQHGDEIDQINSDLGGLSFYEDNTGKYVVGADSVPKKLGSDLKIQTKSATYPMAGVNGEQTVDFSVVFDGISGYKLAYAGIQQLNTYISNGTIKYVEFTSQRISGNTVTWSVHTQRGTGGGNNTCVVQGIFIPT